MRPEAASAAAASPNRMALIFMADRLSPPRYFNSGTPRVKGLFPVDTADRLDIHCPSKLPHVTAASACHQREERLEVLAVGRCLRHAAHPHHPRLLRRPLAVAPHTEVAAQRRQLD